MDVNADFGKRASTHAAQSEWVASPDPGVERLMLDRIGGERARATSLVRFAPGASFSPHEHGGGEEIFVLEGVLQDEHGDFPTGSYLRDPPGSAHSPRSELGCVLFVKLRQMRPDETERLYVDTRERSWHDGSMPGVSLMQLYDHPHEHVRLERWTPGTEVRIEVAEGLELFVLDGGLEEQGEQFVPWSWLRLPGGVSFHAHSTPGATLFVKDGRFENVG